MPNQKDEWLIYIVPAAARKKALAAKQAAEEALENDTTQSEEIFRKQTAANTSANAAAQRMANLKAANKAPPALAKNTDVKDYAAKAAAPTKKSVHKPDAAAVPVEVDSATAGIEKKKKKKKPKPTYNLAGALSKGENIPGVTDKPKQALPKPKAAAAARPAQAKIGEKATSMPKPEEIETLPVERPTQKASAKKQPAAEKSLKKEKTYHPDAQRSTQEIQDERKKQEIAERIQKRRQGLGGQAMDQVGNLGQGALGTVDQLGQNLPVGSKAVSGATRGVGNTLGAATKGLGGTLDDTTGALGRGDIGGTLSGATKGVGDTVGGIGKGLVCFLLSLKSILCMLTLWAGRHCWRDSGWLRRWSPRSRRGHCRWCRPRPR